MKTAILSMLIVLGFFPTTKESQQARYLFYLHGRIVEEQGVNAVSPQYGPYEYGKIVKAFSGNGFKVISERRPRGTDADAYAKKVAEDIKELLGRKDHEAHITVVGASKGGFITLKVAELLQNKNINYAVMGICSESIFRYLDKKKLCGRFLSIYEDSDSLGTSCNSFLKNAPCVSTYREIMLKMGNGHGFIYRPYEEWLDPLCKWAKE